ncbi:MAG: hypothetical protein KDJ99_13105, partial [Candidatus Competibacteraceae bacterium]|nr:hypothetical protein [Candidatus Competibacteraceae bacterium]
ATFQHATGHHRNRGAFGKTVQNRVQGYTHQDGLQEKVPPLPEVRGTLKALAQRSQQKTFFHVTHNCLLALLFYRAAAESAVVIQPDDKVVLRTRRRKVNLSG